MAAIPPRKTYDYSGSIPLWYVLSLVEPGERTPLKASYIHATVLIPTSESFVIQGMKSFQLAIRWDTT